MYCKPLGEGVGVRIQCIANLWVRVWESGYNVLQTSGEGAGVRIQWGLQT